MNAIAFTLRGLPVMVGVNGKLELENMQSEHDFTHFDPGLLSHPLLGTIAVQRTHVKPMYS